MEKIKRFLNNYGRYIFVFVLVFLIYEVFAYGITYGDPICNYGFSYAIRHGQIPYSDFNTISTPLYAFVMSVGLFIFDNYLMFIIEQSILVTIMFYLLYKMYDKKAYIVLLSLILFGFYGLLPTYNFMCFLMMVILLYLEKFHNKKDLLIGVFIGLSILSKHTIGAFFVIPSIIFYFKDFKRLFKRGLGALIPGSIFIIYLLCTGSFIDFINLCFGGLLDFGKSNGNLFNIWFYLTMVFFIIMIINLIKNRGNILNWYLVFSIMFAVPIFDAVHFWMFIGGFVLMMIPYLNTKYDNYLCNLSIILMITLCIMNYRMGSVYEPKMMKKINRFNYTFNDSYSYDVDLKLEEFLKKYDDYLILSYYKMFDDISHGKKLDYFSVPMYGNFGYDGLNKMIKRIDNMHDKYIVIDNSSYKREDKFDQFVKEFSKHVIDTCEKVDSKYGFDIYYKK